MEMKPWTMLSTLLLNCCSPSLKLIFWYKTKYETFIILLEILQDYPKLSQTYYVLLECLAQDHMAFLATLEPQVKIYLI